MVARFAKILSAAALIVSLVSAASLVAWAEDDQATSVIVPQSITAARWLPASTDGAPCSCLSPDVLIGRSGNASSEPCTVVCLGARGLLIAKMTARFANRIGPDLRIYERGSLQGETDDPFSVFVSANGHEWVRVADAIRNDPGRSSAEIDLGTLHGHFRFIRILAGGDGCLSGEGGPGFFAIEALHPSIDFGR